MHAERNAAQKHQTRTDLPRNEHHSDEQRKPSTQRAHPAGGTAISEHKNEQQVEKESSGSAANIDEGNHC